MSKGSTLLKVTSAIAALMISAGSALAADMGSIKDEPVEEGKKLTYSFTIGAYSDYVFRGISQTAEDPTVQGSFDVGYGIFYAGVWASGLDFNDGAPVNGFGNDAEIEIDVYGGIKPVWGPVTFDFGVLGYLYPGASDEFGELDYVELKGGASFSPFTNASVGGYVYWSPAFTGETGDAVAVEGVASYTFSAIGPVTPTLSGLIGYQEGEGDVNVVDFDANQAGIQDDYVYWNVGVALAIEKLTIDLRYWDTDTTVSNTDLFNSDERFVAAIKVTLP